MSDQRDDSPRAAIYAAIDAERERQDAQHGPQRELPVFDRLFPVFGTERTQRAHYNYAKADHRLTHSHIISEESAEAWQAFAEGDLDACRREMVEAAACWIKAIEALDSQRNPLRGDRG